MVIMKKMNRIISVIITLIFLNQNSVSSMVNAYDNEVTTTENATTIVDVKTTGLINLHSISVKCLNGKLAINAETTSTENMKQIGLKNIVIQYSSNNSNWIDYSTLDDMLVEGNKHILSDYSVNVSTGYYRVKCDHYAKEKGIWFPDDETISNTSNSVYIS